MYTIVLMVLSVVRVEGGGGVIVEEGEDRSGIQGEEGQSSTRPPTAMTQRKMWTSYSTKSRSF